MKLKRFSKFFSEKNLLCEEESIKEMFSTYIFNFFNSKRLITKDVFKDSIYECILSFINEFLSDHDVEQISKEEIDNVVSNNIKSKIYSYDSKNYRVTNYLDLKDERVLAIPKEFYKRYVFFFYKNNFIISRAMTDDSWKDSKLQDYTIPNLFAAFEDFGFRFETTEEQEDFVFTFSKKSFEYDLISFLKIPNKNVFKNITIDGDFHFSYPPLATLPKFLPNVSGEFTCYRNRLTSLKGSPKICGRFDCFGNKLESLEGAPSKVFGDFNCYRNKLTSLKGAPKEVKGNFNCSENTKEFTEEEVRAVCKVGGNVIV
jgi:hypothetical protein